MNIGEFPEKEISIIVLDFYLNLIQSIILISLSFVNDLMPVTYLKLRENNNKIYTLIIFIISYIFILSIYLFFGFIIKELVKGDLVNWFIIIFFLISSIFFVLKGCFSVSDETLNDILLKELDLINSSLNNSTNKNKININKKLTTISEMIDESKYTEENNPNVPLLNNNSVESNKSDKDDNDMENIDENNNNNKFIVVQFKDSSITVVKDNFLNFGNFVLTGISIPFNYNAVCFGSIISIIFICIFFNFFNGEIIKNLLKKNVNLLFGTLLFTITLQLYLYQEFK